MQICRLIAKIFPSLDDPMDNKKYTLAFKMNPDLPGKYNSNLPSNIRLKDNMLSVRLERPEGETGQSFKTRAERLVLREARRICLLEGKELRAIQFNKSEPNFNCDINIHCPTG